MGFAAIRRVSLISLGLVLVGALTAPGILAKTQVRQDDPVKVTFTPYNPSDIYRVGDKVGWTIAPPKVLFGPGNPYTYTVRKNNFEVIQSGKLDFSTGSQKVEVTVNEPAMIYLEVKSPLIGSSQSEAPQRSITIAAGAAVAPEQLKPSVSRPADFDDFWQAKVKGLMDVPANPVLVQGGSDAGDVDYWTITMDHVNGGHVHGQLARPRKPGKCPAVLVLQWASPPYPLQRPWVTDLASKGWIALNIEPHDVLPDQGQDYYNALPQALKNYNSIGWDDRDKSYFVQMYLADYRAVEYLASRPDWDGKTLVVMGTSMGGQQSLCVAGLNRRVTHVIVEEPSGCDLNGQSHSRQVGYPFFPSNNPQVMATAPYVDAVNFASRIRANSLVAMGFVDTIAPAVGIWTAFNQIRGPKEVAPLIEAPHNNTATREQQQLYFRRSAEWLNALVKGEKVKLETPRK